ncbi:FUSC family protein [Roseivirga spongicola]|uniref:FUSC family protein n=1 Tax=Roseivirga spongicola TaxID=333140 RepID=UPI002AC966E4|nr:FUSC family protein [Roseivirga spongicola]WPZ10485.1 FUSC family protein [Roseivirga spongicola]
MKPEKLSQLTDDQLLELAKQNKPSPVIDAFFIGFLIGIIIYGAIVNALGFLSVIPLFLIYKFLKKPQQHKDLMNEIEKRGLK